MSIISWLRVRNKYAILAGCLLEIVYCLMHRVSPFRILISGGVKTSGAVAAVFAVDRPIGRDRDHRWRFQCDDGGKPSRTEIEVLATLENGLSVVGCRLITGRTHQVRVHLAAAGHPVLGDRLYHSKRADLVKRPLLHATALSLPHPATDEHLRVVCPPPADLAKYLPKDLDLSRI